MKKKTTKAVVARETRGSIKGLSGYTFTPKEMKFLYGYLESGNISLSAREAGFGGDVKHWSSWLRKPKFEAEIDIISRMRAERADINAIDVVRELARIAFSDLRRVVDWGPDGIVVKDSKTLSPQDARMVAEIEQREVNGVRTVRIKTWDKNKALNDLTKVLGMQINKVQLGGSVKVNHEVVDPNERAAQIMAVLGEIQGNMLGAGDDAAAPGSQRA